MNAPTFRLCYLPANAAWAFVFGDTIIGLDGWQRLFSNRAEALAAAFDRGLFVGRDGHVSLVARKAA